MIVIISILIVTAMIALAAEISKILVLILFVISTIGAILTLVTAICKNVSNWIELKLPYNPSDPWFRACYICFTALIECVAILCYLGWNF